ncbi:MAG: endonuclease III domain-containing protein [Desulfobacteraceae bacterium]|nr:MAG: endonuclease III domain-containing protein [Desulfobacteraceae bacterium]
MTSTAQRLREMYDRLMTGLGPQNWWPGDNTLEILVGIILAQNTRWPNAQKALADLKQANLLSVTALLDLPDERLAALVEPAGHVNLKVRRLKNLAAYLRERFEDDVESLKERPIATLREELLAIKGIGLETVDLILLYACQKPVFVVDAATFRILQRHGLADEAMTYDELLSFFMDHLPHEVLLFKEFHALIARTGREFCRKQPLCEQCPLCDWGHRNFTTED